MKAVIAEPSGILDVVDLPNPEPGVGEVLVRIEYGGICGSDLAYWKLGASGTAVMNRPMILGHEVAGVIVQLGAGVTELKVDQKVTIHPAIGLGELPEKIAGRTNLYPIVRYYGSAACDPHTEGAFCGLKVVPVDMIRPLPDNVSTRQGAVAEPLGVAMHAVKIAGDVQGKSVLVSGCGPIGVLVVAAAKYAGASRVIGADVADSCLKIATAMGADEVVNLAVGEALPKDVDVSIEASGAAAAIGPMLTATARGGVCVQVGNLPGEATPIALGQLVTREIEYRGSYRFVDEISDAVTAMANGLDVEPVLTHEFPIDEALEAFETAADRSTGSSKVLLKIS